MASITYDHATRQYPDTDHPAIDQLDIKIKDGEFLVLVGPSGCGKSTALRMLAGLEDIDKGTIWVGDREVTRVPVKERDIAIVSQSYAVNPNASVADNIGSDLKAAAVPKPEIRDRVEVAGKILDLSEVLDQRARTLSDGQNQRVALGRAIVRQPQVFLFDDPLSFLDANLRAHTRAQISALQRRLGTTTVYVTADQTETLTMGDRIAVLKDGVLQQIGTPREIFNFPRNVFVASFVGSPAMNIGIFQVFDGAAQVGRAQVPLTREALATLKAEDMNTVILGFRPEALDRASPNAEGALPILVEAVEEFGTDAHIFGSISNEFGALESFHFAAGESQITVRIDPHDVPRIGDTLWVTIRPEEQHTFSPASSLRLTGRKKSA